MGRNNDEHQMLKKDGLGMQDRGVREPRSRSSRTGRRIGSAARRWEADGMGNETRSRSRVCACIYMYVWVCGSSGKIEDSESKRTTRRRSSKKKQTDLCITISQPGNEKLPHPHYSHDQDDSSQSFAMLVGCYYYSLVSTMNDL